MRPIFIILFLSTALISNGQPGRAYSYHVVGTAKGISKEAGTGFFVSYHDRYFLVSAWHCFSFRNHITKEFTGPEANAIDDLYIYSGMADLKNKKNYMVLARPKYMEIKRNDTTIDISAIEVDRKEPFLFNYFTLEKTSSLLSADAQAYYFGFPIIDGRLSDTSRVFEGTVEKFDRDNKEYLLSIEGFIGCSGAPLLRKVNNQAILTGVLYYALKDESGHAFKVKALDISWLQTLLDKNGY